MSDIELREESQALQIASDALDRHLDGYDRELFRAGWLAGRDWARRRSRMLGCLHTPFCASVAQCVEQESLDGKPD